MPSIVDIIVDPQPIVRSLNNLLKGAAIDRTKLAILGHIAYRVETTERYNELVRQLSKLAILHGVTEVAGRPIATFEFHEAQLRAIEESNRVSESRARCI